MLVLAVGPTAHAESCPLPGVDAALLDPPDEASIPRPPIPVEPARAPRGLRPHHVGMIVGGGITLGSYLLNGLMALLLRGTAQLGVGLAATPGARSPYFDGEDAASAYAEQAWIPVVGAFLDAGAIRDGGLAAVHGLAGVMQLGGLATILVSGLLGTVEDGPVTIAPLVDPSTRTAGLTLGASF